MNEFPLKYDYELLKKEQVDCSKKIEYETSKFLENNFQSLDVIVGLDISYSTIDEDLAFVGYVVMSLKRMREMKKKNRLSSTKVWETADCCVLDKECRRINLRELGSIPYRSGFLAYREMVAYRPLLNMLLSKIKNNIVPDIDLIIVDGNGRYHEREYGIASAIGYEFNYPTIGVAKKFYHISDGLNKRSSIYQDGISLLVDGGECIFVERCQFFQEQIVPGTMMKLIKRKFIFKNDNIHEIECLQSLNGIRNDEFFKKCLMTIIRPISSSKQLLFVSVGNKINLLESTIIVQFICQLTSLRLCEITRYVDIFTRRQLRVDQNSLKSSSRTTTSGDNNSHDDDDDDDD
ncbi:hypothetical protein SNEBB_010138 [Seison nebaliae]|nr:hypothetical protein SNEBB_010138 [Seison nebaliae]